MNGGGCFFFPHPDLLRPTSNVSSDPQVEWADKVDLIMSNLTGPQAPHYFKICKRSRIGLGSGVSVDNQNFQPNADDVLMVVKDMMASLEVQQIILLVPAAQLPSLDAQPLQPQGKHTRRPISDIDRNKVREVAEQVRREGAINPKACSYLVEWAQGTRRRLPKPETYTFLNHRVAAAPAPAPIQSIEGPMQPAVAHRPVRVLRAGGRDRYLPADGDVEEEDGHIDLEAGDPPALEEAGDLPLARL